MLCSLTFPRPHPSPRHAIWPVGKKTHPSSIRPPTATHDDTTHRAELRSAGQAQQNSRAAASSPCSVCKLHGRQLGCLRLRSAPIFRARNITFCEMRPLQDSNTPGRGATPNTTTSSPRQVPADSAPRDSIASVVLVSGLRSHGCRHPALRTQGSGLLHRRTPSTTHLHLLHAPGQRPKQPAASADLGAQVSVYCTVLWHGNITDMTGSPANLPRRVTMGNVISTNLARLALCHTHYPHKLRV